MPQRLGHKSAFPSTWYSVGNDPCARRRAKASTRGPTRAGRTQGRHSRSHSRLRLAARSGHARRIDDLNMSDGALAAPTRAAEVMEPTRERQGLGAGIGADWPKREIGRPGASSPRIPSGWRGGQISTPTRGTTPWPGATRMGSAKNVEDFSPYSTSSRGAVGVWTRQPVAE